MSNYVIINSGHHFKKIQFENFGCTKNDVLHKNITIKKLKIDQEIECYKNYLIFLRYVFTQGILSKID